MRPEDFRAAGHQLVDWLADYMEHVEDYPVLSSVAPGWVRAQLPEHPPEDPESFDAMLADVDRVIMPGVTHWQSPNFFAYFPSNASGPSILGELLSAGLGVQGMLWITSPACTELETHMLDWLVDLLGLPERFRSTGAGGGVIQDSASSATLCALIAARERATDGATKRLGAQRPLVAYATDQAHSSVTKAVQLAGLGSERLRTVGTDATFAMDPASLQAAMEADVSAGREPCFVVATVGTTGSGAIDPVREIAEVCRRFGAWLHVDAAMHGSAAVSPEHRDLVNRGLEAVDSYCFNPHKWLLTNFDCDCMYVADRSALTSALSVDPEYLRNAASESGEVIDYRDWQIPLGRRFRALKLWFVLRTYGAQGLRAMVDRHIELARWLTEQIERSPSFELAAPAPLNLVCFRHGLGDHATIRVRDAVNASGLAYLTHTSLDGRVVLRMSIGQQHTERRHVERAWSLLSQAGATAEAA